jgi:hypothetical protein
LHEFGRLVRQAFGRTPYLVGSAVDSKEWRDVDVVVMLDPDEWAAMFDGAPAGAIGAIPKARALCMAFSALGQQMTGLPIDFKIQQVDWANERHDKPREALILADIEADR